MQSSSIQQPNNSQDLGQATVFAVETEWLNNWYLYLKAQVWPGELRTSKLLDSSGRFDLALQSPADYFVLTSTDWYRLVEKFGAESEIPLSSIQCGASPVSLPFKSLSCLQACPEVIGDNEPVSQRTCFPTWS